MGLYRQFLMDCPRKQSLNSRVPRIPILEQRSISAGVLSQQSTKPTCLPFFGMGRFESTDNNADFTDDLDELETVSEHLPIKHKIPYTSEMCRFHSGNQNLPI